MCYGQPRKFACVHHTLEGMLVGCLRKTKTLPGSECATYSGTFSRVVEAGHSALWIWKLELVRIASNSIFYYFGASIYYLDYYIFFFK